MRETKELDAKTNGKKKGKTGEYSDVQIDVLLLDPFSLKQESTK